MTQEQTKNLPAIDMIRADLGKMESQFKAVLPAHITPEKFTRVVMTALQTTPSLLLCNKESVLSACMMAAQDGLLPDGREGAVIPFKGKGKWMPMVGGILKKIRNSGELKAITARIVYEKDKFRMWVDDQGEHLLYEPEMSAERGEMIGCFALATVKSGDPYIEFMNNRELENVRNVSKAENGPWDGPFFDEMVKKTVLRRLSKRMPMSTDAEEVIRRDDDMYELNAATPEAPKIKTVKESMAEVIEHKQGSTEDTGSVPGNVPGPVSAPKAAAASVESTAENLSKVSETFTPVESLDPFPPPPQEEKPLTHKQVQSLVITEMKGIGWKNEDLINFSKEHFQKEKGLTTEEGLEILGHIRAVKEQRNAK